MEQIRRLLMEFSDPNALSGLSGLKAIFFKWTWSLADLDFSVFPFSWAKFELAIIVFHLLNFQLAVPNYVYCVGVNVPYLL